MSVFAGVFAGSLWGRLEWMVGVSVIFEMLFVGVFTGCL